MTIYIVKGSAGGYEYRDWDVKAFVCKFKAMQLMKNANARDKEIRKAIRNSGYTKQPTEFTNKYDPDNEIDYDDTYYYISTLELDETF